MKNGSMIKRMLAMVLCLVMLFTVLPWEAVLAVNASAEEEDAVYSITYHGADGAEVMDDLPKTFTQADLPLWLNNPWKNYYDFDGWYWDEDFNEYAADCIPEGTDHDVQLYARWTPWTMWLNCDLRDGEGEYPDSISYDEIPYVLQDPVRDGYVFLGWAVDGNRGNLLKDNTITEEYFEGGGLDLTAQWISESAANAPFAKLGSWTAEADEDGAFYRFVPAESARYVFWSTGTADTVGEITPLNGGNGWYNDDSEEAEGSNFRINADLEKGVTYVLNARFYDRYAGTIQLNLKKLEKFVINSKGVLTAYNGDDSVVEIPAGVTSIASGVFAGNQAMTGAILPAGLVSVGSEAFMNCRNLEEITLPATLKSVGEYAFAGCNSLRTVDYRGTDAQWETITIADGNKPLLNARAGEDARDPSKMGTLRLGENVFEIADGEGTFMKFTPAESGVYSFDVGRGNNRDILVWLYDETGHNYLGYDGEFTSDQFLRKMNAGETWYVGVRFVDVMASGKVSVIVEKKPEFEIRNHVLVNYYGMGGDVVIPEGVTEIGESAFFETGSSLTSVRIPEGVTTIGRTAFVDSNLKSVTIPLSMERIKAFAFANCYNLERLSYPGSADEWGAILIDERNESLLYAAQNCGLDVARYTINYHNENWDASTDINPDSYTSVSPAIVLQPLEDSTGRQEFVGWFADEEYTQPVKLIPTGSEGDIDLYAQWREKPYTITYLLNGGTANDPRNPRTYSRDDDVLTLYPATREGYEFVQWTADELYDYGVPVETIEVWQLLEEGIENLTLTAKWRLAEDNPDVRPVGLGTTNLDLDYGESVMLKFVAPRDALYQINAKNSSEQEVLWTLFDSDMNYLHSSYQERYDAKRLESGQTYYISVQFGSAEHCGKVTLTLRETQEFDVVDGVLLNYYGGEFENVVIPGTVTTIGSYVFTYTPVTNITIPTSVKTIRENAFLGCEMISKVNYAGTAAQWNSITIEEGNWALEDAYKGVQNLFGAPVDSLPVIREGETTIEFRRGESIYRKFVPTRDDTYQIKAAGVGNSVVARIYWNDWDSWVDAESGVTLEAGESYILALYPLVPDKAFTATIRIGEFQPLEIVDGMLINYYGYDSEVVIPEGVEAIAPYVFYGNCDLERIILPASLRYVGHNAFTNCDNLKTVDYRGTSWDQIQIEPGNACLIDAYTGVETVLPEIEPGAHSVHMDSYETLRWKLTVSRNGEYRFKVVGGNDCRLEVYNSYGDYYGSGNVYLWSDESYVVKLTNWETAADCILCIGDVDEFIITGGVLTHYLGNGGDVVVPAGATAIGSGAFRGVENINSVKLPEGLTTIGANAFSYCDTLGKITLPASLQSVGDMAFLGCTNLSTVVYNGTDEDWANITIGDGNISLLKAHRQPVGGYAVNYVLGDGGENHPQNPTRVEPDEWIVLKAATREGYDFAGWALTPDGSTITAIEPGTDSDITLYAKWDPKIYTVTYKLAGGTNHPNNPTMVTVESETVELQPATRAASIFIGWFADADYQQPVHSLGASNANVTLYAKWESETFTITYNADGGTVSGTNPTSFTPDDGFDLLPAEKPGCEFLGWYDADDVLYTCIRRGTAQDLELTARWDAIDYRLILHYGEGEYDYDELCYTVDSGAELPEAGSPDGYKFIGWFSEEGNQVENIPAGTIGDIELYARFEEIVNTITYVLNGGVNHPDNPDTFRFADGWVSLKPATREGYSFARWYGDADYTWNITADEFRTDTRDSFTAYATWEPVNYTITYDVDGDVSIEGNPQAYTVEDTITLAPATRPGYTFAGWYNETGRRVTEIKVGTAGDMTLTAKWTAEGHTITYVLNDGGDRTTDNSDNEITFTTDAGTTLAAASRNGYTFAGWFTDEACDENSRIDAIPAGTTDDVTVYAAWTPTVYTVTYVGADRGSNPASYTIESDTVTLTAPAKAGYSFSGWYLDEDCTNAVDAIPTGSVGDLTLYAGWSAVTYPIRYELGGGIADGNPTEYSVETAGTRLQDAIRLGYEFTGWYMPGVDTPITAIPAGITGELTLQAGWELVTYTIRYELNGGTEESNTNPTTYTTEDTIVLTAPQCVECTFGGWYSEPNLQTPVSQIKDTIGNLTLYAKWIPIEYTVEYQLNGGTNSAANPETYTYYDASIELEDAVRTGYTFDGWFTDEEFADSSELTKIAAYSSGDLTLYAKWAPKTNTISYMLNGGTAEGKPETYVSGTTAALVDAEREGYEFTGWYTDRNLKNRITSITADDAGDLTLYAGWNAVKYTITYELDGGKNSRSNPATYTIEEYVYFTEPVKTGFDFGGWYTDAEFTQAITKINVGSTGSVTVYAQWTQRKLAISYIGLGGDALNPNPTEYTEADAAIVLQPATRPGYAPEEWSWYLDSGRTQPIDSFEPAAYPNGIILYAGDWGDPIEYTITYELGGGTATGNPETYTVESGTIPLVTPKRSGYKFCGWYLDKSYTMPTQTVGGGSIGDLTVYAKWEKLYTITYKLGGGKNSTKNPTSFTKSTATIKLASPTRKGYTFKGWYKDSKFKTKVTEIKKGTSANVTLYAKWAKTKYTITYKLNGGKNASKNPKSYYITTSTIKLAKPTKSGYTFVGWYKDAKFKTKITKITKGSTGNLTLYAKWKKK